LGSSGAVVGAVASPRVASADAMTTASMPTMQTIRRPDFMKGISARARAVARPFD
jgi:hypothetical protein